MSCERNRNSKVFRKSFLGIEDKNKNDTNQNADESINKSDAETDETESVSQKLDQSVMSKSEEWENNSDTPDITIEINDSTTTLESSTTEEDDIQANLTIDDFLGETETIANDLNDDDADQLFSNLITRATGRNKKK